MEVALYGIAILGIPIALVKYYKSKRREQIENDVTADIKQRK
jgi:mannose/fructose/N-acetylgalactosamine-specific phosphotransferase system component IIC